MLQALKSLVVILAVTVPLFVLARLPVSALGAMTRADYRRRSLLWLLLTVTAFLANSIWIYVAVAAVLIWYARSRDSNPLGLYLFLLMAIPPISAEIGALGLVNFLFAIEHTRLLALFVLLPVAVGLALRKDSAPFGHITADWCLLGYLALMLVIQLTVDTVTSSLRVSFYAFLGAFLPYYVASRLVRDQDSFRDTLLAFVVGALPLAMVGMFEFVRHWLLYEPLADRWGATWGLGRYLDRGDSLRALASSGHPIVLGYLMAVALGVALFVRRAIPAKAWLAGMFILLGGLVASLSRGPWVGAVAMLGVFVLTGRRPWQRIALPALLGVLLLPILVVFGVGQKYLDFLPFIGSIDAQNVSYRARLLQISLEVIADSPWLGNYHFLDDMRMQTLMQGDQLVDMVNSYLVIALHSGVLGLALVLGFFIGILRGIWREMQHLKDRDSEEYLLGRVLLATLSGILLIIFTTSSIGVISHVYWTLAGLGAAYVRMLALRRRTVPPLADLVLPPLKSRFR